MGSQDTPRLHCSRFHEGFFWRLATGDPEGLGPGSDNFMPTNT